MPEPVERVTRARVVDLLRIAEGIAGYAAREVGNGLGPEAARVAVADAAAELEAVASALRRLARPDDSAQRRAVAVELAAAGWPRQAIAERLGVTGETARRYLRARPGRR
jgi:DNA-binding NarL/FixJ family response regulator